MDQLIQHALLQYLITSMIPDDFWEPVKVILDESQIKKLNVIECTQDCIICSDTCHLFVELNCCKNNICMDCTTKWFNESVNCPYCKTDLRTYLNN